MPRGLVDQVLALPKAEPLVFGKEDAEPDGHLLRDLKTIANDCSLDRDRVWLHKFRATGATRYFQANTPLPDIMHLGGWKDFNSVRRYMGLLTHSRIGGGR